MPSLPRPGKILQSCRHEVGRLDSPGDILSSCLHDVRYQVRYYGSIAKKRNGEGKIYQKSALSQSTTWVRATGQDLPAGGRDARTLTTSQSTRYRLHELLLRCTRRPWSLSSHGASTAPTIRTCWPARIKGNKFQPLERPTSATIEVAGSKKQGGDKT